MADVYIYALRHPFTKRVAYVGQSANPRRRLQMHLSDPVSSEMGLWLSALGAEGLAPEMFFLAVCGEADCGDLEAYYIALYRRAGHPVLNSAGSVSRGPAPDYKGRDYHYEDEVGRWVFATLAAHRLGITTSRLRQLRIAGVFPSARQYGRDWFYLEAEMASYKRTAAGRPRRRIMVA